jgi:hypothetical protein
MQLTISKTNRGVALPVGGVVGTIQAASSGLVLDVTMMELESVRARLVALTSAGLITWSTTTNSNLVDDDAEGATVALVDSTGAAESVARLAGDVALDTRLDAVEFIPVVTEATGARLLSDADNGKTILCTNVAGCTVTVPNTLTQGFSVSLVQVAAGAITLVAAGTTTFLAPASIVAPYTSAEQGAVFGITKISATVSLVEGNVA